MGHMRQRSASSLLVSFACAAAALATVATPRPVEAAGDSLPTVQLLADVDTHSGHSRPDEFIVAGENVFFTADDGVHGEELWVRPIAGGEARMLADIRVGPDDSSPETEDGAVMGGLLFFAALSDDHGRELWVTDGSEPGTKMVADIRPGNSSSNPSDLAVVDGELFFSADDGTSGTELWRYDGSSVAQLSDINAAGSSSVRRLTVAVADSGGEQHVELFFVASDGTDTGLYSWDGVAIRVHDLSAGVDSEHVVGLRASGPDVYANLLSSSGGTLHWLQISADGDIDIEEVTSIGTPVSGVEIAGDRIYASSGSGADQVFWVFPSGIESTPIELIVDETVYVQAVDGGNAYLSADGPDGFEPWYTDGSVAGTVPLGDLNPGSASSFPSEFLVDPISGVALFGANDGTSSSWWSTDGTASGTSRLGDFAASPMSGIVVDEATWWVTGDDGSDAGIELFITDSTVSGTALLADIDTTTSGSSPDDFIAFGDGIAFRAAGRSWRSSPTGAKLTDIGIGGEHLARVGDQLLTIGCTDDEGCEPYALTGEPGGDRLITETTPGSAGVRFISWVVVADDVAFMRYREDSPSVDNPMWATDLTAAGSVELLGDAFGGAGTAVGERLLFQNDGDGSGRELWGSDGTVAGTARLLDIRPGTDGSNPRDFVGDGTTAWFLATDVAGSKRVYETDGTAAGTAALTTPFDGRVDALHLSNDTLIAELTSPGDIAVSSPPGENWEVVSLPADGSFDVSDATASDGRVFLPFEPDDFDGEQLAVIENGSMELVEIGDDPGYFGGLESFRGRAYFVYEGDSDGEVRLWIGDGSDDLLEPLFWNEENRIENLNIVDGRLYFAAETVQFGIEPYVADLAVAPTSPTAVVATAGDAAAHVSWAAPADNGGRTEISYEVTASPGGAMCSTDGAVSCTVTGLTNGVAHTFTVVATTASGVSPVSAASNAVTPTGPDPDPDAESPDIESLTPARVLESRPGEVTVDRIGEVGRRLAAGETYRLDIAGRSGVAADAAAVVLNVTSVAPAATGFFTIFPCGDRPLASSLNFRAGEIRGNEVIAKLSSDGDVCIYTPVETHITGDVVGFVPSDSPFSSLDPGRVIETRPGEVTADREEEFGRRLAAGETVEVQIGGRAGVDDDAIAAVVNITAVNPAATGYLTIFPCGVRPLASSLNYGPGDVVGNEIVAKLSSTGSLCIYSSAETHLTGDAVGFVPVTSGLVSIDPARFYETRPGQGTIDGLGAPGARLAADSQVEVQVGGRNGIPDDARAVVMNVTAITPSSTGYFTLHPCGDRPLASSLNFGPGDIRGNEVVAKLSSEGTVCLYTKSETHVAIDVVGYIT
ncbi:hypothetical protein YM304_22320 [Ilumatobacter coccineus YM16-304]|uniref:Fibronectin type-III domain-containing protein n=1 Tax=Ilumatobacter coccineus (strain NBRC 103263 / KCTC 29153 / YM16-304) TaxID=1313172 RepID=A0A6C7EEZ3_ILUCY|nr:hypothetical protein YM304_22320 [Ilumatobacter coccineus YM16-304]